MVVDAHVYYWTASGMMPIAEAFGDCYILVREAERLLEEAHARGKREGIIEATSNASYREGS